MSQKQRKRASKLRIDGDITCCRKLKMGPSIFLVRDSRFAPVSWTQNKEKSVDHCTRQHWEVFNLNARTSSWPSNVHRMCAHLCRPRPQANI
jgi:hypothetical protein